MSIDILRRVMALAPEDREELLGHLCSEFPETVQEVLDEWFLPAATASQSRRGD